VLLIAMIFSSTEEAAAARAKLERLTIVHPYDDYAVIAGQCRSRSRWPTR